MNNLLNIRLLKVFDSIVKHQGFIGAQDELNLSASALSNHLSALEESIGFKLCLRGRGGFQLTEKGERYYQNMRHIMEEIDQFNRATAELNNLFIGNLRIGILDGLFSNNMIPISSVIREFNQKHPSVNIHLTIEDPQTLQKKILDNELTVAIGSFNEIANGIWSERLFDEEQYLYCGHLHPLATTPHLDTDIVSRSNIVGRSYWSTRKITRKGFNKPTATADCMESQLLMILSGQFVGYLPEEFAKPWVESGELIKIMPEIYHYQASFSMLIRKDQLRDPIPRTFRQLLSQSLAKKK